MDQKPDDEQKQGDEKPDQGQEAADEEVDDGETQVQRVDQDKTAEDPVAVLLRAAKGWGGRIGALTAVGVAAHGYGALVKASEFIGEGQDPLVAVPLIPLEQLLVTGIIESLVIVVAGAIAFVFLPLLPAPRPRKRPNRFLLVLLGALIVVLLVVAIPWYLVAGFVPIVLAGGAFALVARRRPHTKRLFVPVVAIVAGLSLLVLRGVRPDLAQVTVTTKSDGHPITGVLVASTDSTTYVGVRDRRMAAVPQDQIENAAYRSTTNRDDPSIYEEIVGTPLIDP
jgi:hypothetical protein